MFLLIVANKNFNSSGFSSFIDTCIWRVFVCSPYYPRNNIPKESCNIVMYIVHDPVFIMCTSESTKYHPNISFEQLIIHNNWPTQKLIYNINQKLIYICCFVFCNEFCSFEKSHFVDFWNLLQKNTNPLLTFFAQNLTTLR